MSASAPASRYSFLALVLAVFMFGYVALVTDRLALRPAAPLPVPAGAGASPSPAGAGAALRPAPPGRETGSLAPRCAALCKIAMALTMGFMLVLML